MKLLSLDSAIKLLRDIVMRDTGAKLSNTGEAEARNILVALARQDMSFPSREFISSEVTIMLADLRGFTALAAGMPPSAVIDLLNPCLVKMSEIIFRYDGTIDKFMGDSIMVLFGAPVYRADDVQRAVACAIEMQIAMNEMNIHHRAHGKPELFMGIGINTGEVLAGTLGSPLYSEYTVIGDEVNLASRIEAFSLRGQVLVSESTHQRCNGFVEVSGSMEVFVKGKPTPISLREVLSIPSLQLTIPRQEVRRSHRVTVHLPAEFQCIENNIVIPDRQIGTLRDLGYYGIFLESETKILPRTEIKLSFNLPRVNFDATDVYAKVVTAKEGNGKWFYGVEFTSISELAMERIQWFVQLLVLTEAA